MKTQPTKMRSTPTVLGAGALALLLALPLAGCGRDTDGATASAVAPGRPGTGNPTVVVSPAMPGSITESPGIGGSRGLIPEGATGEGAPQQRPVAAARPGVGLDGGLPSSSGQAAATAAMGAASAPQPQVDGSAAGQGG